MGVLLLTGLVLSACGDNKIAVPDAVGQSKEFAEGAFASSGLGIVFEEEESSDTPEGQVMRQVPEAGAKAEPDSIVKLIVAVPASFTVTGTLVLFDDKLPDSVGRSCSGSGGYSNVNSNTAVLVETFDGSILTRSSLGEGRIASNERLRTVLNNTVEEGEEFDDGLIDLFVTLNGPPCLFEFDIDVTTGSDGGKGYVVKVGNRGELFLTEDELRKPGAIGLSLGL